MADYGYWTFDGKNGLVGSESQIITLLDGRTVIQKDPDNPALLEDDFILHSLSHSENARSSFKKLFPTLDEASQKRLTELLKKHPDKAKLVKDRQDWQDQIQSKEVRAGVRLNLPKPKWLNS